MPLTFGTSPHYTGIGTHGANAYQALGHWYAAQSSDALNRWHNELQDQLRENGASVERWHSPSRQLDIYPWLISGEQWQPLRKGLQQRHRLLSQILHDVYGPQRLLAAGIIPAELVFRCADFLPECHGIVSAAHQWLPLLSTDVAPLADGSFCAFSDSCKTPAGLGFALEHRLALKQHLPELSQCLPKQQLAGFFRTLRQVFQQQGSGITALLTSGKRDAAYFEQAYLANYLDFSLVHSADLMYVDGKLWLKTLSGLQPVATLLRNVHDRQCDPLALDNNSRGVAGLVHSIRLQQVNCANPPGAALVDSGILLPYLEQAAAFLLNEPLLLKSACAYWLAEPSAQALATTMTGQAFLHDISNGQQDSLLSNTWQERPADFILRPALPVQSVSCYNPQRGNYSAKGVLRFFSIEPKDDVPVVMPGAYARLGDSHPIQLPSHATLGQTDVCKDVWVLGDDKPAESLLQPHYHALPLSRESGLLPSRVADHLFWLGRYNERLNLLARALRVALPLLQAPYPLQHEAQLHCFINFCLTANGGQIISTQNPVTTALNQLFSPSNPLSVIALLQNLVYNAQSVREYFSDDTWYLLDKLQAAVYQWPASPNLQQPMQIIRLLDEVVLLQTAIYGMNNETMSRTQALRFMDIGQHLERAYQTSALLERVFVHTHPDAQLMEALLRMADTLMTYRRRYRTELNPLAIIDLLLVDTSTPRSVGYQIARLKRQTADLPELTTADRKRLPALANALSQILITISAQYPQFTPHANVTTHEASTRANHSDVILEEALRHIQQGLRTLSDEIALCYFTHAHLSQPWSMP